MTMKKIRYLFYIMVHPVEGFEEMRWNKDESIPLSFALLGLWLLSLVFNHQLTGFIFNLNRPQTMNILILFAQSIAPFILWTISNWSLCTLMDGKGKYKEIWILSAYSLTPYLIISFIVLFLSNYLTLEEGIFLAWLKMLGFLWSLLILFQGLRVFHEYTVGKTVFSIFLTIAGVLVIVFLMTLSFTLVQQVITFFRTIYFEVMFRGF